MLYYFSSEYPLMLKVDGKIIAKLNDNIISLSLKVGAFVETAPLKAFTAPINFIADDDFLSAAYLGLIKADLDGGCFVKFIETYHGGEFIVISQKKFNFSQATAYFDNGYKISVETANDFFVDNLDFYFHTATFFELSIGGEKFIAVETIGKEKFLTAYAVKNKITKVFSEPIDDFSFNGGLSTTKKYADIAKHTVKTFYGYNNSLVITKTETFRREGFSVNNLPFLILPFAFFEAVLTNDELSEYLTPQLLASAEKLRGYLGDFIGVIPPPDFRSEKEAGLIYKKADGLYYANYFTVEFEGRLISNIIKL